MINKTFTTTIGVDINDTMWTCVLWPESVEVLGTGKAIKIIGTVDGHPIESALLPTGNGSHMLSLNKKILKAINRNLGDTVEVFIKEKV